MRPLNISSFIWGIADDVLRDVYIRGKYRDVILPMTVVRRPDAVPEPTKDAVLRMKAQLDDACITPESSTTRPWDAPWPSSWQPTPSCSRSSTTTIRSASGSSRWSAPLRTWRQPRLLMGLGARWTDR